MHDPLRKREEFAESLRKKKRNEQITKKRRKLTDSKKKLLVEAAASEVYAEKEINYHVVTEMQLRQGSTYQGFPEF